MRFGFNAVLQYLRPMAFNLVHVCLMAVKVGGVLFQCPCSGQDPANLSSWIKQCHEAGTSVMSCCSHPSLQKHKPLIVAAIVTGNLLERALIPASSS